MSYVACVLLPNLPIALVCQDHAEFAQRPLVLYAVTGGRAVVAAASDDAGVAAGTPLRHARVRCPQAVCLVYEPGLVARAVAALEQLLGAFSPRVAVPAHAPDVTLTLDLGRIAFAQVLGTVERIGRRIRAELSLAPAIGVASNQLVAVHAARRAQAGRGCAVYGTAKDAKDAKDGELLDTQPASRSLRPLRSNAPAGGFAVLVPPGAEADFLAPQPIATLGLSAELVERLARLGLRTAGELARLPLDALQAEFGGIGLRLSQLARGFDAAPVPATADAPTLSRARRFAGPLLDHTLLEQALAGLAARLAADLAAGGWSAGALALTFTLEEGAPLVLERALAEPSSAAAVLTATLLALGQFAVLESGVTAVTASAQDLAPVVAEQLELFAPAGGQAARLRAVLDRLGGRFAPSLLQAELADSSAALPERRVTLRQR